MFKKNIRPFTVDGEFESDSQIPKVRTLYENLLDSEARDSGYVPVLDLETTWATSYDEKSDRWFFSLTLYTMYLGKRKAWQYEGYSNNQLVPTRKNRPEK